MRGLFIGAGIVAVKSFRPVLLAFAGFLVFSSFKMLTAGDDDDDDGMPASLHSSQLEDPPDAMRRIEIVSDPMLSLTCLA